MPLLMKDRMTHLELKIKKLQDEIESIQKAGQPPDNKKAIKTRIRAAT
jgi:hypothetical protein